MFLYEIKNDKVSIIAYCRQDEIVIVPSTYMNFPVTTIGCSVFSEIDNIKEIVLPDSLIRINARAFYNCKNLEKINFPPNLEFIEEYAFKGCESLSEIILPKSVATIKYYCFSNCISVKTFIAENDEIFITSTSLDFGNLLEHVSFNLYENLGKKDKITLIINTIKNRKIEICEKKYIVSILLKTDQTIKNTIILCQDSEVISFLLNEKNIKLELTEIQDYFYYYIKKEHTKINAILLDYKNNNFTKKEILAFEEREILLEIGFELPTFQELQNTFFCTKIDNVICINGYKKQNPKVHIPIGLSDGSKITCLKNQEHSNLDNIESIQIDANIFKIESACFKNCRKLKQVILPDSITEIGELAFEHCTALEEINMPKNLTKIETKAFYGTHLTEVILYENVRFIANKAFENCSKLEFFQFSKNLNMILDEAFQGCVKLKEVTLYDKLVGLGSGSFMGCSALEKVEISSKLVKIRSFTFYGCHNLRHVILPNTLEVIGTCAFVNCVSLEEITIPENVKLIEREAFLNCISLKKVNYLGNIPKFENDVFDKCPQLEKN